MKKRKQVISLLTMLCLFFTSLTFTNSQGASTYVIQNTGSLVGYEEHINEQYRIQVTGATGGRIWGTDIYTSDSNLATAAVHAGFLKADQMGILTVTILEGQEEYLGSTKNGIISYGYGGWGLSYRIDSCVVGDLPITATGGVIPDPGNLKNNAYTDNQVLQISLVGSLGGSVWGSEVYTDDSDLSTAAVHAGLLNVGEAGIVQVTILPGQGSYSGSVSNGVTSGDYGSWGGAYKFGNTEVAIVPSSEVIETPYNLVDYRGQNNIQLQVRLIGALTGSVWGSDVYTDDSALSVAAVHAGILKVGQSGIVTVTILPGNSSYIGSVRNGVTSFDYGSWYGSYRFDEVNDLSSVPSVYKGDENIIETFDSGVRMSWSKVNGLGYRVFRSTSVGDLGISVTDFYLDSTSFADVNVEPDTTYFYTVKSVMAEADPLMGKEEVLGDIITTYSIRTSSNVYVPGSVKNFIILQLDNPYFSNNGISQEIDPSRGTVPMILSGRTVVPIRAIVEAMGGSIQWEGNTQKITMMARGSTLIMWVDKTDISVNGVMGKMDVGPKIVNNRTFVPIRFVAQNFNCKVEWLNSTKEAVIVYTE